VNDPALATWLDRLERRGPESRIDLGLDRVRRVWQALGANLPDCPVITVAGTNGKGSVVAMIEAMALAAGLRPFAYTSPHLIEFGERMRVAGQPAGAADVVTALDTVERARGGVALTYFEHITLAALVLARDAGPDVMVLEVGLGGRLDAVNLIDADVAVITSIGLDHTDWLGRTRARIAREKAGVARSGRPVIVGEKRRPPALEAALADIGAHPVLAGRDLRWRSRGGTLGIDLGGRRWKLPRPAMHGAWQAANAACAVAAVTQLEDRLPVDEAAMAAGLGNARLPARFQRFGKAPLLIADVAHNAAAARGLARSLGPAKGRSLAVFSALAGKDLRGIARALDDCFTEWLVAGLGGERGLSATAIDAELACIPVAGRRETVESVPRALELALERAGPDDRIVVFGSFLTVAEAWPILTQQG
jgi:dihydrofolate synthase / folylpolyglutamate synthase